MTKSRLCILILMAISLIFTGCFSKDVGENSELLIPLKNDAQATIKMAVISESANVKDYIAQFQSVYPNIKVDFETYGHLFREKVENQFMLFEKWVEEQAPDLIMFYEDSWFSRFAEKGLLIDLATVIKADSFDIENINSNLVEYFKTLGNGKLYGLSPNFYSTALFYNKAIFQRYGVEFPHDNMSWEKLIQLASRFPNYNDAGDRLYGFALNSGSPFALVALVGQTSRLSVLSLDGTSVQLNTPQWRKTFERVLDGYRSGFVYYNEQWAEAGTDGFIDLDAQLQGHPFTNNQAAMTIQDTLFFQMLLEAETLIGDNWEVAAVPVDPAAPDEFNLFQVSQLTAINARSANLRAAWELLKFINSEGMAKARSKLMWDHAISARTAYSKERGGRSLEPFYAYRPSADYIPPIDPAFSRELSRIASEEMMSVLRNEKSIDEMMEAIQMRVENAFAESGG